MEREVGWEVVDWTLLALNRYQWLALVNTVMNGEFRDQLSCY